MPDAPNGFLCSCGCGRRVERFQPGDTLREMFFFGPACYDVWRETIASCARFVVRVRKTDGVDMIAGTATNFRDAYSTLKIVVEGGEAAAAFIYDKEIAGTVDDKAVAEWRRESGTWFCFRRRPGDLALAAAIMGDLAEDSPK